MDGYAGYSEGMETVLYSGVARDFATLGGKRVWFCASLRHQQKNKMLQTPKEEKENVLPATDHPPPLHFFCSVSGPSLSFLFFFFFSRGEVRVVKRATYFRTTALKKHQR